MEQADVDLAIADVHKSVPPSTWVRWLVGKERRRGSLGPFLQTPAHTYHSTHAASLAPLNHWAATAAALDYHTM